MAAPWPAPLFPVLESLDVQVELDFVSPGSFDSLAAKLQANPTHYHLVHLDGMLLDDNGSLLFEGAGSRPYPVGPATLAEALRAASVPALMVSAGDRGSRPAARINAWNNLGTRLASAGVPVSIVLPHSFPEPAVAEGFLRRLFTSLVGGEEVGQALSAARAGLMDEPHRSSPGRPPGFLGLDYAHRAPSLRLPARHHSGRKHQPPGCPQLSNSNRRPNPMASSPLRVNTAWLDGKRNWPNWNGFSPTIPLFF